MSVSCFINPLSAKFIKWSNTLKQFVGNLPTNCLSVFDHFVGLALKGLRNSYNPLCTKSLEIFGRPSHFSKPAYQKISLN